MDNEPSVPADLDDSILLDATDELIELWWQWVGTGSIHLRPRRDFPKSQRQAAVLITHTQHLFQLVKVIRPHLPRELPLTLVPVAREALETGIWILWVDRFEDAAEVAINEAERNRKNLKASMIKSSIFPEGTSLEIPEWTRLDSPSSGHTRSVESMTDALKLPELYAFYRMFSGLSHPGIEVSEQYLRAREDRAPMFRDAASPGIESVLATRVLPLMLLKATRIITYLTDDKAQRRDVRGIARGLLVDVDDLFKNL